MAITLGLWDKIKTGDRVQLKWTGYPRVPKFLSGTWATVEGRNSRGNLVIQADGESTNPRVVQFADITGYLPKERIKTVMYIDDKSKRFEFSYRNLYGVVGEYEKTYIVIDNLGNKHSAYKTRFEETNL